MVADSSYFRSSMAFTTVCAPYCSVDGTGLLFLPLVNGFDDLRAVLYQEWQRIAHSCARQLLSRRFARRLPQPMAGHCSFFRSSMAFTVWALFCATDASGFLVLPLVNGFLC